MKKENFSILVSNPLGNEYIQRLAFKAGYDWNDNSRKVLFPETKQLIFRGKIITRNPGGKAYNLKEIYVDSCYSFPTDALKIYKIFNTPEYKVGDYVVLKVEEKETGSFTADMCYLLGTVQEIENVCLNFERIDLKGEEWAFNFDDISRHATEEEIKVYKGEGDIYIGEHKVEFLDGGSIKVGCVVLTKHIMKAIETILYYTFYNGGSFVINKKGIKFTEGNAWFSNEGYLPEYGKEYSVPKGQFDKIISLIKAGAK